LASAFSPAPTVEAAIETEVHMFDPAGEIVDGGGTFSKPIASLFQSDSMGLRLRLWASWVTRAPGAVAWMSATNW
jgi:hypothetical protein